MANTMIRITVALTPENHKLVLDECETLYTIEGAKVAPARVINTIIAQVLGHASERTGKGSRRKVPQLARSA